MTDYVLIGNSIAANSAAARIHSLDPDSPITMIADEPEPYYSRCALMYFVMDHCAERDTYIADKEHYRRLNARVVHDRVVDVEADAHELRLQSGNNVAYDKLLIASGSEPRKLGVENEDADGIYDFVTLEDARQILADIQSGKATRAVVVGGGMIGAEVVEAFHFLKIPVDYLVRESQYLYYHIFCSNEQSRIIEERFAHHGVRLHMERSVERFEKDGSGRVVAAIDDRGERYEADIAVRAIGVEPNIGFLEGSGLEYDRGVLVDDRMKNAAADVWAAGDCAEIRFPGEERTVIQKLWYTAQPQGWIAGDNMAGGDAQYELMPQYQSAMFMDLDFASYGDMPAPWNELQEETVAAGNGMDAIRIVHDGQQTMGASVLGRTLTKEDAEYLVQRGVPLEEARAAAKRVFSDRYGDRASHPSIAPARRLSRRPYFWPFGQRATRRGWMELTGGF